MTSPMSSRSVNAPRSRQNVVERGEMPRQGFGHARADVQDAEAEQHPPQVARFARRTASRKFCADFSPMRSSAATGQLERIKIRHVVHEAVLTSCATSTSPPPSMSIAPRAHQCSSRPRTCAGQSGFTQRQIDAFVASSTADSRVATWSRIRAVLGK